MNKLSLSRAAIGLLAAAAALPATAQQTETRSYLSVNYDHVFQDNGRASDSGTGYSFGVGKALNQYWGLEFGGFYDQFQQQVGGSAWREYGAKVDGLFFYSRDARFSPYFGLGLGGMQTDLKTTGQGSFDPFADAGVGFFKYFPVGGRDLGLRADLRYRWTDPRINAVGTFGEPVVRVGLVMPFGARAGAAGTQQAASKPGLDSDGDGVLDDQDQCPGTVPGAKVDEHGCSVEQRRALAEGANRTYEDVHFAFDKSDLTDYAKAILDDAAKTINGLTEKYPGLKVDVSGHTDWVGTEGYNQALSERRAEVVRQYLSRKGVESKRVTTHAYGETKPVAPNDTDEGRALNRRAEVKTHAE